MTDPTDANFAPSRPPSSRRWWVTGFWVLVLWGALARAAPADVRLPNGEYGERHTDLAVKVLGGTVALDRTWSNGRWYLNPAWAALRFVRDPLDGSVKAVDRAGSLYVRQGELYVFDGVLDSRRFMDKTPDGWRWRDGTGNWIEYDAAGRPTGYGDRNNVRVRFVLDAEGRRLEIRDHLDQLAIGFSYQDGRLVEARDRSGRAVRYAYEGDRLTEVTDAAGAVWRYEYDGQGQLTGRTDPLGGKLKIFYAQPAPAGAFALDGDRARAAEAETGAQRTGLPERDIKIARVGQITDEAGRVTTYQYAYDRLARQYTVTTLPPGGPNAVARYDRDGRLLERTVGGERQRLLARDGDRIESVTDARGLITRTEYDADRRPLAVTTPDGATVRYEYTQSGQVARYTDELGIETRYRYDGKGNPIERIEAVGRAEQRMTAWAYDAFGQRLSETLGSDAGASTTRWSYDSFGNVATQTDPLGQVQRYTHNAQGQAISWQDPGAQTWKAEYDAAGRLTASIDPLDHRTAHAYDALGRRLKTTDPTGAITQYQYDPTGRLTAQTDALGQITRYDHDAAGRLAATTDPAGNVTRLTYDGQGRLAAATDPAGNVTRYQYGGAADGLEGLLAAVIYPTYRIDYRYDARDRPVQTIQTLDETTKQVARIGYDGKGQAVSRTDPAGQTTLSEYDGLGRVIRVTDALGGVTGYQYDARDQPIALTDANGQTHRFEYDLAGRAIKEIRPLGGATQYAYDSSGRLASRTDAAGNVRRFIYDAAGRKIEETQGAGQTAPGQTIRYQYDAAGRLAGYEQSGDTVTRAAYALDALGRPTEETLTYGGGAGAFSRTLRHGYTPDGRRQRLDYPGDASVSFRYDQGRLQATGLPGGGEIRWAAYQWRQPTRIEYPGAVRQIDYDPLQRPSRLRAQAVGAGAPDAPAGPVLLDWRYRYDPAGNLTQKDTPDEPYVYGYDKLSRLTEATPPPALQQGPANPAGLPLERYAYDPVHNRQSSAHQPGPWAYNADHQLIQYGQGDALAALSYTATGHLETERRAAGQTRYGYDAAERLRRFDIDGQERARYQYDPFGRRIAKTVAGQTTWYVYAPEGLVAELDQAGHPTRAYGWQPDAPFGTAPLWQAEIGGARWQFHFLQTDHLGTPQLAADSQGHITWQGRAEAFGRTTPAPGSALTVNLRFPGQYYDQESNLHYNYFRDYDPATGRYVQSDPIGLEGGINTYLYAESNPLYYYDPLGLCPPDVLVWCQELCASEGKLIEWCGIVPVTPFTSERRCYCDQNCKIDSYANPGHHDPTNSGPNNYNPTKEPLPKNHKDLWKNSLPDPRPKEASSTRWTREGSGKNANFHRFVNDNNGNWHWNGSTQGGTTGTGEFRRIEKTPPGLSGMWR